MPGVPTESPTGFSQSQASANKSTLAGFVNQIAVGLSGNIGSTTNPMEAAAALVEKDYPTVAKHLRQLRLEAGSIRLQGTANCEQGGTVTYTDNQDAVDNDGDGIPVYAEIRYNNCKESGVTANGLLIGLQDKNDADPKSGFTILVDVTLTNGTDTARLALGIDYTPGAGGAYNVRYGHLIQQNNDKIAFGVNMTYTPKSDGNSDPYDAGFVNFTGRFVYKASGEYYVLDMLGENLEYSSSCTSSFVGGKATFQDNAGNKLVIQYNGCNSYTITYNGNPI